MEEGGLEERPLPFLLHVLVLDLTVEFQPLRSISGVLWQQEIDPGCLRKLLC